MNAAGSRNWPRRVRALNDRRTRQAEGVVFVEGIRQVLDAFEGGRQLEAILVDPTRLRSERAWRLIDEAGRQGVEIAQLSPVDFERVSSRDNPAGLAATVRWRPADLRFADAVVDGVYLATDDVRDPGNLGTIIRTADALGAAAVVVHGGVDPGHPAALRSSLGSAFRIAIHTTSTLNEFFYWAQSNGVAVVGSSASAPVELDDAAIALPVILLLGNEAVGLAEETLDRCDGQVKISMAGSASSLNVAVAAGILLHEIRRRLRTGANG